MNTLIIYHQIQRFYHETQSMITWNILKKKVITCKPPFWQLSETSCNAQHVFGNKERGCSLMKSRRMLFMGFLIL